MPRIAAIAALLLVALIGVSTMFARRQEGPRPDVLTAGAFSPAHEAPTFTLRGSNGSDVSLKSYRGKVVLLEFGFTNCAAVCPTTLATLAQARTRLGVDAKAVQVIFVTVDPERDSPTRLREYMAAFDPTFLGATGTSEQLAAVRRDYGVTAVKTGSGPDYAMAHTSSIFLIDPAGKLRAMMPFGHSADEFAHDVKLLLMSRAV